MVSVSIHRCGAKGLIMHATKPLEVIQDAWCISGLRTSKKESLPGQIPKRSILFDIESSLQHQIKAEGFYLVDKKRQRIWYSFNKIDLALKL